jgi:hypothetical protein
MSIRQSFAGALFATAMFAGLSRAHADPAPQCGSRLRTALVELNVAGRDAHQARVAVHVEKLASTLHLGLLANMARHAADAAAQAEASATRTAIETLMGRPRVTWPPNAGPTPHCPTA